nr:hypothetical protein [Rikenellaceae bacterium]
MKQMIFRYLGMLLCSAGLFVACSEDETTPDVAPEFPALTTAEVSAGEVYTFTITPNTTWSLALTDASVNFFALLDGQSEVYRLRGEAGTHEIKVRVSTLEEFDTARQCEAELTLGTGTLQETRTILRLTRKNLERGLSLYLAAFDATADDFKCDEEGAFLYEETAATTMGYYYDAYNYLYRQRFAVEANFTWVFTEVPAWFGTNEVLEGGAGRTELFSRVEPTAHPFEDTTFELGFLDVSNPNNPVAAATKVEVSLPGCEDFCVVERVASTVEFDKNGAFDNNGSLVETGMIGTFSAPMGARLLVAAKEEDRYTFAAEKTAWVTITEEQHEEFSTEYGIWPRNFTLTVAKNEAAAREAILVAVPQTVAKTLTDPATLLTEDGTALKEASYLASTLKQKSGLPEDVKAIEAVDPATLKAWGITFDELSSGSWPWMGSWASIPYAYKVNYTNVDAIGDFFVHVDYASYRIFGFDAWDEEYTDLTSCWIALEEGQQSGSTRIKMRLGESYTAPDGSTKTYENTLAGDGGENEATIVFYDEQGVAQVMVYCTLTEPSTPGGDIVDDGSVSFVDAAAANAAGVYLKPIATTDEDYDPEMSGLPQYRLIFTQPTTIQLNVPSINYAFAYADWLSVDPQMPESPVSQITVTATAAGEAGATGTISIHVADFSQPARILAVYNPDYQPETGGTPEYDPNGPVTFVDMAAAEALGATLLPIVEGDDAWDAELDYKGIPQLRLTLKKAGTLLFKVPAFTRAIEYTWGDWILVSPDWSESEVTELSVTMNSKGGNVQNSRITLHNGDETHVATILCVLTNEE